MLGERREMGVSWQVYRVLDHGNPARFNMVEELQITPDHSAQHGILRILQLTARSIQSLLIIESFDNEGTPFYSRIRDYVPQIQFPNLTHFRQENLYHPKLVIKICQLAPNLVWLDLDLSGCSDSISSSLSFSPLPHLRTLRCVYGNRSSEGGRSSDLTTLVTSLLSACSKIHTLTLQFGSMNDRIRTDALLLPLERLPNQTSLHWDELSASCNCEQTDHILHLPTVQKLIFNYHYTNRFAVSRTLLVFPVIVR